MQLCNLTEKMIRQMYDSLRENDKIEYFDKEDTLVWLNLQFKEQQKGGAWKKRIREEHGMVI
jgi:hypothetical protein